MNTKLIERYLKAVKTFLPRAQQDDIAQELSEDILSRLEAQEAELGRPLTDPEQEAVLKQLGHPALVAGRYRTDDRSLAFGRQLIGPVLFPLYLRVVTLSSGLTLLGTLIALLLVGELRAESLSSLLWYPLVQFAIVTAIFTAAQAQLTRHPDRWDPRDPLSPLPAVKDPRVVARSTVIVELVVASAVLLWLRSLASVQLFPGGELVLAPIWRQSYQVVLLLTLASLVPPAVNLFQPRWLGFRLASRAAIDLAWLVIVVVVLRAGPWVSLAAGGIGQIGTVNQYIGYALQITAAASALQVLYDAYKLLRHQRGAGPAALGSGAALN